MNRVEQNKAFVERFAARFAASHGANNQDDIDDAVGEGLLALVEADTTFQEGRGMVFRSWLFAELERHLINYFSQRRGSLIPIAEKTGELWGRMQYAYGVLQQRLLREPTHAEWAAAMGITLEELHRVRDVCDVTFDSLDVIAEDDSDNDHENNLVDMLEGDSPDPAEVFAAAEASGALYAAIEGLTPDETSVLYSVYGLGDENGDGMSQAEAAEYLGIAQQRVSEIHAVAIRKLRHRLRDLV